MPDGLLPGRLADDPHRRHNPLIDEWVLVSAGRTLPALAGRRGAGDRPRAADLRPDCYLCPGNTRANGHRNPDYDTTFVFDNDFAALRPDTSEATVEDGLLRAEGERGVCRVVCFSPRHDLTLGGMSPEDVRRVIDVWADQTSELGADFRWVQVFENRGAAMGASNPHPHGQVWAGTALPVEAARETENAGRAPGRTGRRLLLDYVAQESGGPRVVVESDEWLIVVPFWAAWPFETLVDPAPAGGPASRPGPDRARQPGRGPRRAARPVRRPLPAGPSRTRWAGIRRPSAGAATSMAGRSTRTFYPPLLRANIRKFMVGYELLAETQRDLTPEEAAERLRAVIVPSRSATRETA